MLIASSGVFERLQGIDLMNIIWQQALMETIANRASGKIIVNTGSLVDTLIKLAAFKRESNESKEENGVKNTSSFTIILILFKSFNKKLT